MSAYQRPPTTKTTTTTTTTTAAAAQGHQFPSLLDDKLIIYGNGLVYGGATYPSPADNVLMQSTPQMAAGGQRLPTQHNSSFTGIPNRPTPRVTGSNSRPPTQQQMHQLHQQQQQQTLQQPQQQQMTQSHELSRGPQYPRYMNQQQPLQQQQQQHQPLQQQQQQLQQAYNYWPFGGMAPTHAVNNNMGMFNGHANQPPQMYNNQMAYGQTWPGYTVMSPADPNKPYTFGMD